MARIAIVATMLLTSLTAHAAQAQDAPDEDTINVADEAGVSAIDLAGAVNTLHSAGYEHVDARSYLIAEGELAQPPPAPAAPVIPSVWQRIAQCESGGNWHANTGNGYYGGLQENRQFWADYGGLAYAARPDLASPTAQVTVASRGLAVQGWAAWPVCSRRAGLR